MIQEIVSLVMNFKPVVPILSINNLILVGLVGFVMCVAADIIENAAEAVLCRQIKRCKIIFPLTFVYIGIIFYFWPQIASFLGGFLTISANGANAFLIFADPTLFILIVVVYLALWFVIMAPVFVIERRLPKEKWGYLGPIIIGPLGEEVLYRYFVLSIMVAAGFSSINAIIFQALLFGYAINHIIQKNDGNWTGCYRPALAFSSGLILGLCAVTFGIVFTWVMHMMGNYIGQLAARTGIFKCE